MEHDAHAAHVSADVPEVRAATYGVNVVTAEKTKGGRKADKAKGGEEEVGGERRGF